MDVSRETLDKLDSYAALLIKWQKSVNLVSPSTLADAKNRHFDDSLQISELIPKGTKKLYDLGSGGGFPGLVLAIANPDIDVTLIESDRKKCSFLSNVSRETSSPIHVENSRIESVDLEAPDVITARALADLTKLFSWCIQWAEQNPELTLIFPKGARADEEIEAAKTLFNFEYKTIPSITNPEAVIIFVHKLVQK